MKRLWLGIGLVVVCALTGWSQCVEVSCVALDGPSISFKLCVQVAGGTCSNVPKPPPAKSDTVRCAVPEGTSGTVDLTVTRTVFGNFEGEIKLTGSLPGGWPAFTPVARSGSGNMSLPAQYRFTVPPGTAGRTFELRFKTQADGCSKELILTVVLDVAARTSEPQLLGPFTGTTDENGKFTVSIPSLPNNVRVGGTLTECTVRVLARTTFTLYVAARPMTFGTTGFAWAAYNLPPIAQQAAPVDYVLISVPGYPQVRAAPVRVLPVIVGGTTYTMVDLGTVSFPSPTCPKDGGTDGITGATATDGKFTVSVGSGTTVSGRLMDCTVKPAKPLTNQSFSVKPVFSGGELDKLTFSVPGYADVTVTQAVSVFHMGAVTYINLGEVCLLPKPPDAATRLVNCVLEGCSFVLPDDVCKALGGASWAEALPRTERLALDRSFDWTYPCDLATALGEVGEASVYDVWVTVDADAAARIVRARLTVPVPEVLPVIALLTVRHVLDPETSYHTLLLISDMEFTNGEAAVTFPLPDLAEYGRHEVTVTAAFGQNHHASANAFFDLPLEAAPSPPFDDPHTLAAYVFFSKTALTSIQDEIDRTQKRCEEVWEELSRTRAELSNLERELCAASCAREKIAAELEFLERQDRILEKVPEAFGRKVSDLLESLAKVPRVDRVPTPEDIAALTRTVESADSAVSICKGRIAELESRLAKLELEAPDHLTSLKKLLDEQNAIWMPYCLGGGYRIPAETGHSGGALWGYVYSETPPFAPHERARLRELEGEIRDAENQWLNAKRSIARLQSDLRRAREECEKLSTHAAKTREQLEAATKGQRQAAQRAELEDTLWMICYQIQTLLADLRSWSRRHGVLQEEFRKLDHCPPESWDMFWADFTILLQRKKEVEKAFSNEAADLDNTIAYLERQIARTKVRTEELRGDYTRLSRNLSAEQAKREASRDAERATPCGKAFAQWIAKNERHLTERNLDDLNELVQKGLDVIGSVVEGTAERLAQLASGAPGEVALASGLAQTAFSLGVTLFYMWVESKALEAGERVVKAYVNRLLATEICYDPSLRSQNCGELAGTDSVSFFFFRRGNSVVLFKISPRAGLEFLGELSCESLGGE